MLLCKKFGIFLLTLLVIVTCTFLIMKSIPGDPFTQEQGVPKEILISLRKHYGLKDPWYWQYGRYLQKVATWNLGPSLKYKDRTVNYIIAEGFPISFVLGIEALLIALGFGLTLGSISALKQNCWQDYLTTVIAVLGVSIPSFVLATLLQFFLSMKLDLFPVARFTTPLHSVLPSLALAALPTAFIARLTRSTMIEVLQQDYIKTAKSKGLSSARILFKHILRNSLLPIMAYLGQLTANIFVGSFIIERIFAIPGLGQWFITSVSNRDYPVIMGITVFYSILLLTIIFIIDIIFTLLDPRLRETK